LLAPGRFPAGRADKDALHDGRVPAERDGVVGEVSGLVVSEQEREHVDAFLHGVVQRGKDVVAVAADVREADLVQSDVREGGHAGRRAESASHDVGPGHERAGCRARRVRPVRALAHRKHRVVELPLG
jgi:hypothetical protein